MKIVFFGTPFFSAYILEKLQNYVEISAVVCPPDKESGRGRKIKACRVKQKADDLKIKVLQPGKLKDSAFINQLKNLKADLFIVVAFRMLPKEVWKIPKKGSVNLHTSLLPNYRGAAPINWAIINGEKTTGISTFFINEKIDQGNIIMQEKVELDDRMTAGQLHNIMMKQGVDLLFKSIESIKKNKTIAVVQQKNITDKKAPKIKPDLCKIDWSKSAIEIQNLIRGLSPVLENNLLLKDIAICPSAWFYLAVKNGKKIRVKLMLADFEIISHSLDKLTIITDNKNYLKIVVKDGFINIIKLQMEGKRAMDVKDFLSGFQFRNTFTVC